MPESIEDNLVAALYGRGEPSADSRAAGNCAAATVIGDAATARSESRPVATKGGI